MAKYGLDTEIGQREHLNNLLFLIHNSLKTGNIEGFDQYSDEYVQAKNYYHKVDPNYVNYLTAQVNAYTAAYNKANRQGRWSDDGSHYIMDPITNIAEPSYKIGSAQQQQTQLNQIYQTAGLGNTAPTISQSVQQFAQTQGGGQNLSQGTQGGGTTTPASPSGTANPNSSGINPQQPTNQRGNNQGNQSSIPSSSVLLSNWKQQLNTWLQNPTGPAPTIPDHLNAADQSEAQILYNQNKNASQPTSPTSGIPNNAPSGANKVAVTAPKTNPAANLTSGASPQNVNTGVQTPGTTTTPVQATQNLGQNAIGNVSQANIQAVQNATNAKTANVAAPSAAQKTPTAVNAPALTGAGVNAPHADAGGRGTTDVKTNLEQKTGTSQTQSSSSAGTQQQQQATTTQKTSILLSMPDFQKYLAGTLQEAATAGTVPYQFATLGQNGMDAITGLMQPRDQQQLQGIYNQYQQLSAQYQAAGNSPVAAQTIAAQQIANPTNITAPNVQTATAGAPGTYTPTGYKASQVSTPNALQAAVQGTPTQVQSQDINAALTNAQNVSAGDINTMAEQLYDSNLVQQQKQQLRTEVQRQLNNQLSSLNVQEIASGNMGSSRAGIAEGIARRGGLEALAKGNAEIDNTARTNALTQATAISQQNQSLNYNAATQNAANQNAVNQFNQQNSLAAQQFNANTGIQQQQFNVGQQNQMAQYNQTANQAAQQFNVNQLTAAAQYNNTAAQQAAFQNIANTQANAQYNAQQQNQMTQFAAGQNLTAQQQNAANQMTINQQNAANQLTASTTNAANDLAAQQFNKQQQMAGLAGAGNALTQASSIAQYTGNMKQQDYQTQLNAALALQQQQQAQNDVARQNQLMKAQPFLTAGQNYGALINAFANYGIQQQGTTAAAGSTTDIGNVSGQQLTSASASQLVQNPGIGDAAKIAALSGVYSTLTGNTTANILGQNPTGQQSTILGQALQAGGSALLNGLGSVASSAWNGITGLFS